MNEGFNQNGLRHRRLEQTAERQFNRVCAVLLAGFGTGRANRPGQAGFMENIAIRPALWNAAGLVCDWIPAYAGMTESENHDCENLPRMGIGASALLPANVDEYRFPK